ncbi:unnamed protein product [Mesocestoides corti]|uniref:P/Homo B domain-containing protein n=1 Tax=Mesocestoides corti TaxID=53468 RepID=A0A3P6H581_MESCO|nr:unnamed protein product [Mesocestoides corti]
MDVNVYPVYAANITGKGVIAIVVDDALDTTHEDLRPNIRMDLTADLLNYTRKDARGTDMQMKKSNDHGTEVAGLLAAVANNSKCAFGVAYNTTLGGVRLLGDKVTDFMVGEALVRFSKEANMYISSWGPSDNGRVMRSPKKYMNFALNRTAHKGNHGRGSVFLFPAGNGGEVDDNCGADGFVNNVHVVSVNAIGENGLAPAYAERCAAVSIAVPIGGAPDKVTFRHQISRRHFFVSTTDINNRCTKQFVGTSASNPMVGGVIALAMEVNPNLTARDVAAILSFSGRIPVAAATDFNINGGGMLVSHTYGAGLLNAVRMVNLAKNWNPLGQRFSCLQSRGEMWQRGRHQYQKMSKLFKKYTFEKLIFPGKATAFTFTFSQSDCPVEVLELVRVEMHWAHERRGSLDVWLISPSGQVANLLAPRHRDRFSGISHMSWKSLIHTGERCHGNWTLMVMDKQPRGLHHRYFAKKPSGFVRFVSMEMLGTRAADSAFEKNKEAISKHWLRIQNRTRSINRAVYLRPQTLHKIYDWQRWDALSEDVEP